MRPLEPSEHQIQRAMVQWLSLHGFVVYHVPNEEMRGQTSKQRARRGAMMKAAGYRAGVADLVIVGAAGLCLHIEVKRPGNKPTQAQRDFAADLERLGAPYVIATSVDELRSLVREWIRAVMIETDALRHPAWDWAAGKYARGI